jgi:DNA-binding LytR/AlgR family response regulator
MDFFMPPGINGDEASKEIRDFLQASNHRSYIVCLTAQSQGDFKYMKNNIFDDYYEKPLGYDQINTLIQKMDAYEDLSVSDSLV